MTLAFFVVLPLAGGLLAWLLGRVHSAIPRWVSLAVNVAILALAASLWSRTSGVPALSSGGWISQEKWAWIRELGISFTLGVDGLSLLLVSLTGFLGIAAVLASWSGRGKRPGSFHLALLFTLAGVSGVFLALDMILFLFFWELMIVPMYFLIDIWGGEKRHAAALKFFIFTQAGGLLMLLSILGLSFARARVSGALSFDYQDLLGTSLPPGLGMLLFLGFLAAFAVKLPIFPLHTWVPDAYSEAPTAGSVVLAGLMSKTAAYGLLRFGLPLFPDAARSAAPVLTILAVAGILYGGIMAFSQSDVKRLVAYASVSHLGFVLLGVFALNRTALSGAAFQMIAHGVSSAALFILAGILEERLGTRETGAMGGMLRSSPRMAAFAVALAMALLGLPGLGSFIGEFLVLLGAWRSNVASAAVAATGLIVATVYALALVQRVFHGAQRVETHSADLSARETAVLAVMVAALIWLGLFPQPVLHALGGVWESLRAAVGAAV